MSCCPPESWGNLQLQDYQPKGTVVRQGDMDIYKVGKGEKCIIWNYDIFGLNAGRTRQTADLFADCGYMVLIPDWYRNGDGRSPMDSDVVDFIKRNTDWAKLEKDLTEKVLPFAKQQGAKRFGSVGTCWGSYMVIRLSALPDFYAGVSWHPSHSRITGMMGETTADIVKAIKCPQLVMPAGNDQEVDKTGGEHQQLLGASMWEVVEFPEMQHGWSVRGDMSDPAIERDVKKAIEGGLEFFKKHL